MVSSGKKKTSKRISPTNDWRHARSLLKKYYPGRYKTILKETGIKGINQFSRNVESGIHSGQFEGNNRINVRNLRSFIANVRAGEEQFKKETGLKKVPLLPPGWDQVIEYYQLESWLQTLVPLLPNNIYIFSPKIFGFDKSNKNVRLYNNTKWDYSNLLKPFYDHCNLLHPQRKSDMISIYVRLRNPKPDGKEWAVELIICDSKGDPIRDDTFVPPDKKLDKEGNVIPETPEATIEGKIKKEIPEPKEPITGEEFTKEERVEIEKEKIRAEAQAQAEVKKEKIKTLKELLKDGIITKEDFFDQLKNI